MFVCVLCVCMGGWGGGAGGQGFMYQRLLISAVTGDNVLCMCLAFLLLQHIMRDRKLPVQCAG